jgi:hypothetical protein
LFPVLRGFGTNFTELTPAVVSASRKVRWEVRGVAGVAKALGHSTYSTHVLESGEVPFRKKLFSAVSEAAHEPAEADGDLRHVKHDSLDGSVENASADESVEGHLNVEVVRSEGVRGYCSTGSFLILNKVRVGEGDGSVDVATEDDVVVNWIFERVLDGGGSVGLDKSFNIAVFELFQIPDDGANEVLARLGGREKNLRMASAGTASSVGLEVVNPGIDHGVGDYVKDSFVVIAALSKNFVIALDRLGVVTAEDEMDTARRSYPMLNVLEVIFARALVGGFKGGRVPSELSAGLIEV